MCHQACCQGYCAFLLQEEIGRIGRSQDDIDRIGRSLIEVLTSLLTGLLSCHIKSST